TTQASRRRRPQWRSPLVLGGAGALVIALVLTLVAIMAPSGHKLSPGELALGGRQADTVLQISRPDGTVVASLLLEHDLVSGTGSVIGIPLDLRLDLGEGQLVPVANSIAGAGESVSSDALSDLLGITIDGSYTIERSVFVGLIDRMGGINIRLDSPVVVD